MTRGIKWDCQDFHTFCNMADRPRSTSNRELWGKFISLASRTAALTRDRSAISEISTALQTAAQLIQLQWQTAGELAAGSQTWLENGKANATWFHLITHESLPSDDATRLLQLFRRHWPNFSVLDLMHQRNKCTDIFRILSLNFHFCGSSIAWWVIIWGRGITYCRVNESYYVHCKVWSGCHNTFQ